MKSVRFLAGSIQRFHTASASKGSSISQVAPDQSTSHPPAELDYTISDSQSTTVLYHTSFADRVAPLRDSGKHRDVDWVEIKDMPERKGEVPEFGAEVRSAHLKELGLPTSAWSF
ncbi:hypothetical protein BDK51DRAFT_43354 [Blyttiomyces helicus]|uniref:Uncharacterized protein n=1 Tax=Blyttiomyces helicus TaxID=388810 RepID=A0A4P9WDA9_9FUNG|nr:hypothetical protein BDK51DRAFT_43354 [Blyttiomyces helicus]|eukprot:RKO90679.1 hypothetical protein BDK51DRAFT_43354 [Blyttiomyces helicus]